MPRCMRVSGVPMTSVHEWDDLEEIHAKVHRAVRGGTTTCHWALFKLASHYGNLRAVAACCSRGCRNVFGNHKPCKSQ